MRLLAVAAVLWAAGPAWADTESYGERHGCTHIHPSKVAYARVRALVRHTGPTVQKARVQHYATCVATRRKAHRTHELARAFWAWRHREPQLTAIREARLWVYYRAHPMPWCTWGPESGGSYTARNSSSSAGGRYQILDSTWYANGGSYYADTHPAAAAPPLEQERVGRNVLASQGLGAWVNC